MKIERLRKKLEEKGLDAFLSKQNAHYLAGSSAANIALVTGKESILLCRRLERDRAKRESKIKKIKAFAKSKIPLREGEEVLFGETGEVVGGILKELDVKRIGYDWLKDETLEKTKEIHEAEYLKEPDLIWDLRKIKTPNEIKRLKKSAEIATRGMRRAEELIEPGLTELEIASEVEYEMRKSGSDGTAFDTILAAGENSLLPHARPADKKLREGELIIVDLGARWKDYRSDMTRTFALSPTPKQEEIIKVVKEAQKAALEKVEAGIEAREVDEAARKIFRRNDYEKFFLHGSGHGVGLDIHEPPSLNPFSEDVLEENMVITVEPGIYLGEVGGVRFEDTVTVKEGGYEKLTPA